MVQGIKNFKHWSAGFEEQYIVIGGVACELLMSEAELQFRATKDIDIVLAVEALTPQFAERFWQYVRNAGYSHINKTTGRMQCCRFEKPQKPEYPVMIELFAGKPNILDAGCGMKVAVAISDDVSSLSAILLDKDYYNLILEGQICVDGIPVLKPEYLIPLKIRAWSDWSERKKNDGKADSRDIRKHRNDVFRMAALISSKAEVQLTDAIKAEIEFFINAMEHEIIDTKAIGVKNADKQQCLSLLKKCYGI